MPLTCTSTRWYAPTGPFPAAMRASLMSVIIDPTTGEEHEVPNTRSNSPATAKQERLVYIVLGVNITSSVPSGLTDNVVCAVSNSQRRTSTDEPSRLPVSRQIRERTDLREPTSVSTHVQRPPWRSHARAFPLLLNCALVNGGGWFVRKLVTAAAW